MKDVDLGEHDPEESEGPTVKTDEFEKRVKITSTEGIVLAERIEKLRERTQLKIDLITAILCVITLILLLMHWGVG